MVTNNLFNIELNSESPEKLKNLNMINIKNGNKQSV